MRRALIFLIPLLLATPTAFAQSGGGDPNPSANDWVVSHTTLTFTNLTHATVDVTLDIHKITITSGAYAGTYSAQDLRDTYDTAERFRPGSGDQLVDVLEENVTERIRTRLAGVLPQGSNLTVAPAQADMATITAEAGADDYHPPVVVTDSAEATIDLAALLGDVDPAWVDAAFDVGATVTLDLPLSARPGVNATYEIRLPDGYAFSDAEGGAVGADGATATYALNNWLGDAQQRVTAGLALRDPAAETFTEQDASLDITVDLEGLDLQLLSLPGGKAGDLNANVVVRGELSVIELPEEAAGQLPESVELTHVSAGHVRHLLREGVITRAQLDTVESTLLEKVEAPLRERLGADATITGGFDEASLDHADAAGDMDGEPPLVFEVKAQVQHPLEVPPQAPGEAPAAITLYEAAPSFELSPIEGFPTTYTVVLPRGMSVTDVSADGGAAEHGVWEDGRQYFTVTTEDGPAQTQVAMAVTPSFVLYQMPELVAIALLGILLPVALFVWRRRAKKAKARAAQGGAAAAAEPAEPAEPPVQKE